MVLRDVCASKCTCMEVSQRRNHLLLLGCSSARSSMVSAKRDSISLFFSSFEPEKVNMIFITISYCYLLPTFYSPSEKHLFFFSHLGFPDIINLSNWNRLYSHSLRSISNVVTFTFFILDQGDFNLNFFHFLLTSFNLWPFYWKKFFFSSAFPTSFIGSRSGWTF